ncbi:hypothetical protein METBIDRAFT_10100 [Metschnikowia bicuspidata var. bicuspidata NRRL YB-4993]|uniref:Ribonuclease n=1 Tax=Metschnikowia bicuspidata var. bicuspidata NRRL YB-4993 TaxID=869754 RepID=A0A1A0HJ30_9ASCO|nr:hypothetical protein METBIDRAFT_10100 [Metschnikowia bicuspidata var. bicuspidata NRRL YB-4993]OBA23892.1 hypothetical protein METBIDRAFT_10100 [Metschnikowia bicuspidata var. bicuspidata NRRL YB-4993]
MPEPVIKKRKVETDTEAECLPEGNTIVCDDEILTQKWYPVTVTSIKDKFSYDSSTYHSAIPKVIEENPNQSIVLGVDEAGRGPVMGPMVYGISYCLESYHNDLKTRYGFADSKILKDAVRTDLFKLLHDEKHELFQNVGWATCTMTAKDISNGMLRSVLGAGSYNLNEQAHDTTILLIKDVLKSGVNVSKIFVDTVGPPASYQAKLQKHFSGIEITVTKKADSIYPIVSTASVVAKVTRDLNLHWYNENVEILKGQVIGSGYPSDPNTSRWLNSDVDKVFGWNHGLVRFLWQTAKDSLVKRGGVPVVYEAECVKDKGYKDIGQMFVPPSDILIDALFYGHDVVL